jgi:CheY-like chemotaxis protein
MGRSLRATNCSSTSNTIEPKVFGFNRMAEQDSRTDWHGGALLIQVMLGRAYACEGHGCGRWRRFDFCSFNWTGATGGLEILAHRRRSQIPRVNDMNSTVPATIVLANTSTDLRSNYVQCLRRSGYDVWEAADGAQALALVRAHMPELLILDTWMPILNGLEVLERLVGVPEAVGVRVIMLSDESDSDSRLEGFALGVVDYWTRDMPVVELRERIDDLMRPIQTPPGQPG